MAYTHMYDVHNRIILVVQSGTQNHYKEMLDWMSIVRADPGFDRKYGLLCDFREGTVQLSSTDAYTCGTMLREFFAGQKIAFVVPDGLRTMVEMLVLAIQSAAQLRSFSGMQAAENWLGAPG